MVYQPLDLNLRVFRSLVSELSNIGLFEMALYCALGSLHGRKCHLRFCNIQYNIHHRTGYFRPWIGEPPPRDRRDIWPINTSSNTTMVYRLCLGRGGCCFDGCTCPWGEADRPSVMEMVLLSSNTRRRACRLSRRFCF